MSPTSTFRCAYTSAPWLFTMSVDPLNLCPSQRIEIGIRSATRGLRRNS
jgi:hypothetical protein